MTDFSKLSLTDVTAGLKAKDFTSVELAEATVAAAEAAQPHLNAFTVIDGDRAVDMAKASDAMEALLKEGRYVVIYDMFNSETTSADEKRENAEFLQAQALKQTWHQHPCPASLRRIHQVPSALRH